MEEGSDKIEKEEQATSEEEERKKVQKKNAWDDWWRGVTKLESTPVTPKTTVPIRGFYQNRISDPNTPHPPFKIEQNSISPHRGEI